MKMDFERVIGFFGIWFSVLMLIWLVLVNDLSCYLPFIMAVLCQ